MSIIKIGIAEDQKIFRKGLVMLLNSFDSIIVVNEAENGYEIINQMANECPDVVILDYNMPLMGGIATTKEIRKKFPSVKIILLSMYDDEEFVENAIDNGANGYLSKDDDLSEIELAIKGVMSNNYYLNDRVSKVFINTLINQGKISPTFVKNDSVFSTEELKVLRLMSKEMTTVQIADELNKSPRTIEKQKTNMMEKVGAQNSIGLIMYGIKNKLIEL